MDDDTPQELFVQAGTGFYHYSGMSKNAVDAIITASGVTVYAFIDKATYDAGCASILPWPRP